MCSTAVAMDKQRVFTCLTAANHVNFRCKSALFSENIDWTYCVLNSYSTSLLNAEYSMSRYGLLLFIVLTLGSYDLIESAPSFQYRIICTMLEVSKK